MCFNRSRPHLFDIPPRLSPCDVTITGDSLGSRSGSGTGRGAGGEGEGEDGLDSSLNLSLRWEGIVLKDVELRRDFLSELLGLPVDVPHAFVRRAVLHLPWYTLMLG